MLWWRIDDVNDEVVKPVASRNVNRLGCTQRESLAQQLRQGWECVCLRRDKAGTNVDRLLQREESVWDFILL